VAVYDITTEYDAFRAVIRILVTLFGMASVYQV
jgi:hypothetical protein